MPVNIFTTRLYDSNVKKYTFSLENFAEKVNEHATSIKHNIHNTRIGMVAQNSQ